MNTPKIDRLMKKLKKLERQAEKFDAKSIPFRRLMKTYNSTEKKIESLGGEVN